MNKKIIICSFGLRINHLTLEAIAAIKSSDIVFTHAGGKSIRDLLNKIAKKYKIIKNVPPNKMAKRVTSSLKTFDKVCFLTYGNPSFLNSTTRYIFIEAARIKAETLVLPGVSSMDCLVCLLGLNKFSLKGLRIVDLAACMEDIVITPEMDTLFFMPCDLNLPQNKRYKRNFIFQVKRKYPPSAQFLIIDVKNEFCAKDILIKGKISELSKYFGRITSQSTIFIKAVR